MVRRDVLNIDAAQVVQGIEAAIREQVRATLKRRGAVVGLSGGIDSSVVATLCVRALGQERVVGLLEKFGLKRGEKGLRLIMMCEVPSNAILAEEFLEFFDGFSIGSNDLTQLTLGLDRDSGMELLAVDFDERDPAVKFMLKRAIDTCLRLNKYVGICGQGPSDHPDFAQWLTDEGIASISLNPDTVIETWQALAKSAKK